MKDILKLSDEKIVELVRKKDKELYIHIIKRYQDKLMRYASYLTGEEHNAADIVQESFIKAYVNLNGFNTKKKFASWIYRIVHNEAINLINKQKKQVSLYDDYDFDSGIDIEDEFIKKELKLESGSKTPGRETIATLTQAQLTKIAEAKMEDLNANGNIEAAKKIVSGTARSMGIKVE